MQDYRGSLATITPCISYCVSFSLQILAPKLIQQLARYNNIIWHDDDNEYSSYMWQSQVENEHYSTVSGLIRLVISLECFIEITPDFCVPL